MSELERRRKPREGKGNQGILANVEQQMSFFFFFNILLIYLAVPGFRCSTQDL